RSRDYDEGDHGRRRRERDDDRDYDDDISFRGGRALAPSWNVVRVALSMIFWSMIGIVAIALMMVVFVLLMAAAEGGRIGPPRCEAFGPILMILGRAAFVGSLSVFAGLCMCIAAPPESRARGLAASSVVCVVVSVLAYFLGIFLLVFMARGFGGGRFGGGRE